MQNLSVAARDVRAAGLIQGLYMVEQGSPPPPQFSLIAVLPWLHCWLRSGNNWVKASSPGFLFPHGAQGNLLYTKYHRHLYWFLRFRKYFHHMFYIILIMALSLWYYHVYFIEVKVFSKFLLRKWQGQVIIWGLLGQSLYFLIVLYHFLVSALHIGAWFRSCTLKCPHENWSAGSEGSHIWALILGLSAVNWQVVGKLLTGSKTQFPEP